jgi:putative ABC transport system substrate-binding protein
MNFGFSILDFRLFTERDSIRSIFRTVLLPNPKSKTCPELSRRIQNRKLVGIVAIVVTFTMCGAAAQAQPAAQFPRVGVLVPGKPPTRPTLEGFRLGLRELGYVEGKNIILELRWNDIEDAEKWAEVARDLARLQPDVILAGHTVASIAAQKATTTIPIVMGAVGSDPVELGLVASFARPGSNVTGMAFHGATLNSKRLELLAEAISGLKRVAVLWNPRPSPQVTALKDIEMTARLLGIELQLLKVPSGDDLDSAFHAAIRQKARAVLVSQGALFGTYRLRIADLALKSRLPTISGEAGFAEAGGLMFYGVNIPETWKRAAYYVDKILKGAKPADLPVERPSKFELIVNLKTAKQIGTTISPNVLARADKVIR